jgi:serine acetyltransferase
MRNPGWVFIALERIGDVLCRVLCRLAWYPLRKLFFAEFHWSVVIHPGCQFRQRRNIALAPGVTVNRGVVLHAQTDGRLVIGENTQLNPYTVIYGRAVIGRKVMIAPHVMLAGGNHSFQRLDIPMMDQGSTDRGGIRIEDDVWVGANVVILDGVTLGTGAIVAAGSVVTKSIDPFCIVAGVPARKIGVRNGSE